MKHAKESNIPMVIDGVRVKKKFTFFEIFIVKS